MSKEDAKKLEDLLKVAIRPLKELIEALKSKVDHQEFYLAGTASNVKSLKEQQSVINEKLDAQGKRLDSLDSKVSNLDSKVDKQGKKLDILWDQVEKVTFGLADIQETQKAHTATFKRIESKVENNSDDIRKVDKRLTKAEGHLGIMSPPELTIV